VFGNFSGKHAVAAKSVSLFGWLASQLDDSATWEYIAWIRQNWAGKIIVKGILDPRDAVSAVNAGADAISVSNHGGTQLDGAPSTISVLPSIVDAVGGKTEIFLDGGIRSGQDVIKALALGAQTCLLGRAYLFGLAANGEAGVGTALSLIRNEMKITLGLTGVRSVGDVDGQIIYH
jgi:L-lactate dehydrogenase (cytochrome)